MHLVSQQINECCLQLGLFAGGLSSFISSDEEPADAEEAEEPATAGMEITALGIQVRPFVFFSGQGELMGHVWSGTGSEKTPAFQVSEGSVQRLDTGYQVESLVRYLKFTYLKIIILGECL